MSKPRVAFKAWLQTEEGCVFGPGVCSLLKKIQETGTLKQAADSLGMSYRFAWGLVKKAEARLGYQLLIAHKGGRSGGGGTEITETGLRFVEEFAKIQEIITDILRNGIQLVDIKYENIFEGVVEDLYDIDSGLDLLVKLKTDSFMKVRLSKKVLNEKMLSKNSQVVIKLTPLINFIESKGA
ncbi:MAG: winged helix-turn-helix domain-containing protein [Candidatus Bathyarchaeia archaeon]